ncbi:hypothetical protein POM88_007879 [Heracleum sosnowskyi]|uniref:CCHC-type domain-containing protein n=1 Tax=Heracleum sosnowskyi TaxID=360622 RepID=A0AAD8J6D5_9APIA|nr:hypothetical protein POM88_007879 [Heracleum sosnowskyi]
MASPKHLTPSPSFSSSRNSFSSSKSKNNDFLYAVDYHKDDSKIPITELPLLNPYRTFTKKPYPVSRVVKQVFSHSRKIEAKELVLASKLEQVPIPSTEAEQIFPIQLEDSLPAQWHAHGYSHLHFGAVRMALTLHGRKGLPVVARMALLDTRFEQYAHACIATVQTTLNARTVFITLFPNFNMRLDDPHIYDNLKVQLQIIGAPQVAGTFMATLHYQMAYRVQNHSFDLSLPRETNEALFLEIDAQSSSSCIHVPKQIPKDELVKLLPESWITHYEKIQKDNQPIHSAKSSIFRNKEGAVEIIFNKDDSASKTSIFSSEINMIQEDVPIHSFNAKGNPNYEFKDEDGHIFWGIYNCNACLDAQWEDDEEDDYRSRKGRKKSIQQKLKERYEKGDPEVGLLGEESGKFDYYVLYSKRSQECNMLQPSSYDDDFPPLDFERDKSPHVWKIKSPTTKNPDGSSKQITPAEATLNWQSKNAVAQNRALNQIMVTQQTMAKRLDNGLSTISNITSQLQDKINALHHELMAVTVSFNSPVLAQKEAELKALKAQLHSFQTQKPYTGYYDTPTFSSYLPPLPHYSQPLATFSPYDHNSFNSAAFLPTKPLETIQPSKRKPEKSPVREPITKEQIQPSSSQLMVDNPITSFLNQMATKSQPREKQASLWQICEEDSESDSMSLEILMAGQENQEADEPTVEEEEEFFPQDHQEPEQPKSSLFQNDPAQGFCFDNISPSKWRDRIYEMHAWCTSELLQPGATMPSVADKFVARFHGRLRQWWIALGAYRQMMIKQSPSVDALIMYVHNEFLGAWDHYTNQAREEYLSMRCCSYKRKDLETHYERMSKRFYAINGIDDVNLKQTFLNSLPEPLGNETSGLLQIKNLQINNTSIGELYQHVLLSLEKLCNQKKFLKQIEEQSKNLGSACDRNDLQIKCGKSSSCTCTKKKEKFSKLSKFRKKTGKSYFSKKKKWRFLRKKKGNSKSSRCYVCRKKGQFAKECPNKEKSSKLLEKVAQIEEISDDDLESLFSLDKEPGLDTILALGADLTESTEESDEDDVVLFDDIFTLEEIFYCQPSPSAKIHIFPSKWDKPISVIAFFDTGATSSIMKPDILPKEYWNKCLRSFRAANGDNFTITLVSKPINIQIFPGYMIKHQIYGSELPGKDLLIGFDILHNLKRVSWSKEGLKHKNHLLPWTKTLHLYPVEILSTIKEDIARTSCAESHTEFLQKCSHPLWKNPEFFVHLSFKKNEDVNPTKASHKGMNPDHYALAIKEVDQL